MTRAERKNIFRVFNCFAFFFISRILEEFLISPLVVSKIGVSTHSLFACSVGIIVLMVYLKIDNRPLETIGLVFSKRKAKKGFLMAILLNAVPMVIAYASFFLYFKTKYDYVILTAYYDSPNNCYSNGAVKFALWIAVGLLVAIVHAVFYEMTFRGLLMKLCAKTFSFSNANIIQASLYTLWFLISALRVAAISDVYTASDIVFLVLFFIVYEFAVAIKLGMCKHAAGALWICIFDHMMFGFICDVLHMQVSNSGKVVATSYNYALLLAYQAISIVIAVVYYKYRMKKQAEKRHEARAHQHSSDSVPHVEAAPKAE